VVSNELIDNETIFPLELNTMPGWAGSSWYLFRYMDAENDNEFASQDALDYWQNVDLYIGGSEHATGHLLYSRFWTKFLYDRGFLKVDEPFKKLINQGMILGESAFVFVLQPKLISLKGDDDINVDAQVLISRNLYEEINDGGSIELLPKPLNQFVFENVKHFQEYNPRTKDYKINFVCFKSTIDVNYVNISNEINLTGFSEDERYKALQNANYFDGEKVIYNQDVKVVREVEKMSKSKYNVVNPDDICDQYGADTLRMYEMFLGPLEQAKPWNMAGITGVHSFLKKFWKLYHQAPSNSPEGGESGSFYVNDSPPSEGLGEALKTLHKTIKKVEEDIENFSFNTSVSTFMIAVNELTAQKCNSREVLEPLAILISPYAPHIAEELWNKLGHSASISTAVFPEFDASYLVESTKEYPISFNGKMRFTMELPLDLSAAEIEKAVMVNEKTQQYLEGRRPKKVIIVPGKIVNIVG
jgi:leucyl-tRNA synthetase